MALLIPPREISSFAGIRREATAPIIPRFRNRTFRIRVSFDVRDLDKGSTDERVEDNLAWLPGISSSQVKPVEFSTKKSGGEEGRDDYHVNTGYAIRTLREEFPQLFYKELSFDIYRDDIVFRDPFNTFSGIENYKSIFWALRFHGRIFFKALWVDIVSVWQPAENLIMVRWIVHGIPRIPWDSQGRFDGTSEYKLDKNGKIYEHKVHNIAQNGPNKFNVLDVEQMIQSISSPSTPKPTYFEFSSTSIGRSRPFCVIKSYLSSALGGAMRFGAKR